MRELLAVGCATLASSAYALSTALQALEARAAPAGHRLRSSLLVALARRRVWLLGLAAGVAGWALQATALALASLALVQPALGLALIVLLVFGVRLLHESVGVREIAGAAAIAAGVSVLAWAAPSETGTFTSGAKLATAIAVAVCVAAPALLRLAGAAGGLATSLAAGCGWACVGVTTALVDQALGDGHVGAALLWGAGVAAASFATLISEMSALQGWPATRAVPIAFALEMALPAALAPLLTDQVPTEKAAFAVALVVAAGGAVLLGSSRAVAVTQAEPGPLTAP